VTLSTGLCLFAALALAPLFGWALSQGDLIFLAMPFVVISVPIVIRWPIVSAFGLYAFLVPFDTVAAISEAGGATLTRIVGILAGAVLLLAGLIERRLVRPPAAAIWWSMFMVWAALSMAWAIHPDLARLRLPTVASLFLLYIIAVSIRPTQKELYWVCALAVSGGAVSALMGYVYRLEATTKASARGTLAIGELSANPNAFAAALILPLALAIGGFIGLRGPLQKLLALGALGILGMGVYISMSRGALVAIAVTILVLAYRNGVRWQMLVPLGLLLGLVPTLPEAFFTRIDRAFTGADRGGRIEIWKTGVEALEQFGVLGAGLGNYTEIYRFSEAYSPGSEMKVAHNIYLGTWVELGILGLVLMLAALASHLLAVHGARRSN
jgi:O-antigen ligase